MKLLPKIEWAFLFLLGLVSGVPRFWGLGFSQFYGDETKTLYLDKTIPALTFFFTQRKAPLQFLATWFVEKVSGGYSELYMRLPFAVAGFVSVFVLYFLVKKWFGPKIAAFSSILFSLNGLYIAFSRTAQYQSLYVLLGLLGLLLLTHAFEVLFTRNDLKGACKFLFLSSVSLGLASLAHYDAIFFIFPALVFFLQKTYGLKQSKLLLLCTFLLPLTLIACSFYIPYFKNGFFEDNTVGYLERRIEGQAYLPNNSLYTLKVYNPFYWALLPLIFALFSFAGGFSKNKMTAFAWFALPFIVFELIFLNPGTHIHNYVLPLIILAAVGFDNFCSVFRSSAISLFVQLGVFVLFGVAFALQTYIYVPIFNSAYPWKRLPAPLSYFMLPAVDKQYHLYLYGFPYDRQWSEVAAFMNTQKGAHGFYTNDNTVVAKYYLKTLLELLGLLEESNSAKYSIEAKIDPLQIHNELQKLGVFVNHNLISEADVRALVQDQRVPEIWDVIDAIAKKQPAKILSLVQSYLNSELASDEKSKIILLNASLADQLRSLLFYKSSSASGMGESDILKVTGWKSGRLFIVKRNSQAFSELQLVDLLKKLEALDFELKTSSVPPRVMVDLILSQI
jgi:hypothetical protein